MPTTEAPSHPAKFSDPILRQLRRLVLDEQERLGRPVRLLDPFAGVGGIHELAEQGKVWTLGVELEEEWAAAHPRTEVGDATALPSGWSETFDVVATSVCYGNRMADRYDGAGACRACEGSGIDDEFGEPCARCSGAGQDQSRRMTYRLSLGRELSEGSAAGLQWGPAYRDLHVRAIAEWERVLRRPGLLLLNTSNHVRAKELQLVTEWFVQTLCSRGWRLLGAFPVATSRYGMGANRDARDAFEMVTAARPPAGPLALPLVDDPSPVDRRAELRRRAGVDPA